MAKIRVKNFGPIKNGYLENDGWIDIKKVTLFIGTQGTGKSTLAKLISTFTWIEKSLVRGDYELEYFKNIGQFYERLYFHNIQSYLQGFKPEQLDIFGEKLLKKASRIDYRGDSINISIDGEHVKIEKSKKQQYHLPQIVYMPAERNLLNFTYEYRRSRMVPETLIDLQYTYREVLRSMNGGIIRLPINELDLMYHSASESLVVRGDDYIVNLHEASSGIQSVVPLYLISLYFSNIVEASSQSPEPMNSEELERFKTDIASIHNNLDLTEEQRQAALSVVANKYKKTAFINIVEEPEQNLFPTSQWEILKSLLIFNNGSSGNKLIMTTHSPYVISFLTLAVKAASVLAKINKCEKQTQLLQEIEKIVPTKAALNSDELVIYEINRKGEVIKLDSYEGLPSDDNYLNQILEQSNILFSQLLDIEDQCQ